MELTENPRPGDLPGQGVNIRLFVSHMMGLTAKIAIKISVQENL